MTRVGETIFVAAIAATLVTDLAQAETWSSRSTDSGALIQGVAFATGGTFALSCTAPSPGGRPLIETGDHESLRTDTPYSVAFSFSIDLVNPFGTDPILTTPTMALDGRTYPLPRMEYSDFYAAWTGIAPIDVPGFLELFQSTTLIVDPGRGTAYAYPVDGLSASLDAAFGPCVERWYDLGHPMPPRLLAYVTDGVAPDQPVPTPVPLAVIPTLPFLPAGLTPGPFFEVPAVAPQAAFDHIAARCSGPLEIDPSFVTATDIDADGTADYIFNYQGLDCGDGQVGGGYCGASNCSIEVFLSTRGYRDPAEFLGHSLIPVQEVGGRRGVMLTASYAMCGETGLCTPAFMWTGTGFTQ